jgi:uncharacterized protein (TIGR03435 family)
VTAYTLIVWAFTTGDLSGFGCLNGDALKLVSGGPDWIRTALWDIQATIPDGARRYTDDELKRGDVPELKMRLRTLLADRFKLVVRPEMRDMPVFLLTYGRDPSRLVSSNDAGPWLTGKEWPEVTLSRRPILVQIQPRNEEAVSVIWGRSASMAELATELAQRMEVGRPVLDRTNLKGGFNFDMWYAPTIEGCSYCEKGAAAGIRFASGPTIFAALEQQAGLKLEAGRAFVEVQVIEHLEMAPEN